MGIFRKKYYCNVVNCKNEVLHSGYICLNCENYKNDFKSEQENLDEWFKKWANPQYQGALWKMPLPENEEIERIVWERLKSLLHERDIKIADMVNKFWMYK